MDSTETGSRPAASSGCPWSFVLAIATTAAILMSGLNALVQIVKVMAE